MLFKFRTRITDLKINFRNRYVDLSHLFQCDVLINKCEYLANNIKIKYENIFGELKQQIETIKLLKMIWTIIH